jgi:hypothetical protein
MSADHDTLIRRAQPLIAARIAMLHTMEALRRKMEKSIDNSHGRIDCTRDLLASSAALLQQPKSSRYHRLPARPMV